MKYRALIISCLLIVPAVRAQQAVVADTPDADPFEFLLDDNNTELRKPEKTTSPQVTDSTREVPDTKATGEEDPFSFLLEDTNTVFYNSVEPAPAQPGRGKVELGMQYVSQDNYTFGQYNGLYQQGLLPTLDVDYRYWQPNNGGPDLAWNAYLQDFGSRVAEGSFSVGQPRHFRVTAEFDQQLQVSNDSGKTPFSGNPLNLPDNWVASNTTGGMTALTSSLDSFNQKLERDQYLLSYLQQIDKHWSMETRFSTENKQGKQTTGAAFYIDAANPHAAILPQDINQTTNDFDLSFRYNGEQFHMDISYLYSEFENDKEGLQWQNPYATNTNPNVDYPNGYGQMGVAPDSDLNQLRLVASYLFTPTIRVYGDTSWSRASQDDNYLPYTINPTLVIAEPLPRNSLDGEVDTSVVNAGVMLQPLDKLSLELKYHYYDRNNDSPRDGYLYPPGDSFNQPNSEFTIYNRPYDITKNRFEARGSYRLPKQARLSLLYQYENINRYNAAVRETDENSLEAALRFLPFNNTNAQFSLGYSDREASTYNWNQSYYALLDTELINQTPDSQRYENHPLLSQYYLSNREQWQAKFNINYLASQHWNHNLDLLWNDNDYDKTSLGLKKEEHFNGTFSSSYIPAQAWSLTAYYSFDYYQAKQDGRAFRGGAEKNAFVVTPPYPQASDPARDWSTDPETMVNAVGLNVSWDIRPGQWDTELDYSFVDTTIEQNFNAAGSNDLAGESLPDDTSRMHHVKWDANYYYSKAMSFSFSYQYYYLIEDNWALDGVTTDTIDKVLFTGEKAPNDSIHVVGVSVLYRLP